jgi:hypothetical protein
MNESIGRSAGVRGHYVDERVDAAGLLRFAIGALLQFNLDCTSMIFTNIVSSMTRSRRNGLWHVSNAPGPSRKDTTCPPSTLLPKRFPVFLAARLNELD